MSQELAAAGRKSPKSMFSPRMPPMFSTPHVTRTHIALGYREHRWHRWPTLPKKIATELVKLQKDDAINGPDDPEAKGQREKTWHCLEVGQASNPRRLAQESWEGICPSLRRSFPILHIYGGNGKGSWKRAGNETRFTL